MTPAALMADLTARGVRVTARGETLRVDAPRGVLTASDRAALVEHKPALLAALRAEACRAATASARTAWSSEVPDGPCGLCGHQPLARVENWPVPAQGRWFCPRCCDLPAATLTQVEAGLPAADRLRVYAEAQDGDPLARLLLELMAVGTA
jgi:hypothetical protein